MPSNGQKAWNELVEKLKSFRQKNRNAPAEQSAPYMHTTQVQVLALDEGRNGAIIIFSIQKGNGQVHTTSKFESDLTRLKFATAEAYEDCLQLAFDEHEDSRISIA